jgi:L1 cell adhesion molecule like protein
VLSFIKNKKFKEQQNILVFDLGGGTFDVSVALCSVDERVTIRSTCGDLYLGGQDFVSKMMEYFASKILKKCGKDVRIPAAMQILRDNCEKAKIQLSSERSYTKNIISLLPGFDYKLSITRKTFETLITDLVETCMTYVTACIQEAGLKTEDIKSVLMVGGSSAIPCIEERVKKYFGNTKVSTIVSLQEGIAEGAAWLAHQILNPEKEAKLIDVLALSLGVEIHNCGYSKMLKKNRSIPCEMWRSFHSNEHCQTIKLCIYEGESESTDQNHLLGIITFYGHPTKRNEFDVCFEADENGILTVIVKYQNQEIKTSYGNNVRWHLNSEELEEYLHNTELNHDATEATVRVKELAVDISHRCFKCQLNPDMSTTRKEQCSVILDWLNTEFQHDKDGVLEELLKKKLCLSNLHKQQSTLEARCVMRWQS